MLNPPRPLMDGIFSDVNNNPTVLRLQYGEIPFLLTGDIHRETELSMVDRGLKLQGTVLKVAHHGSNSSTREELLGRYSRGLRWYPLAW